MWEAGSTPLPEESELNYDDLLRHGFEASPMAISFHRPDGAYIGVNPAWEKLFGRSAGEVRGHHFLEYTVDIDLERSATVYRLLESGQADTTSFTKQYRHLDGSVILAQVTLTAVRDQAGRLLSAMSQIEDITEKRRAVDALMTSEARFRGVFDHSGIGMTLSVGGVWFQVNRALCEMLGRSAEELVGRSFRDVSWAPELSPHEAEVKKVIAGEKDLHTFEHRFRRADGAMVWGRVHLSRVPRPDGAIDYLLGQIEDITAAKAAEDELLGARLDSETKTRLVAIMNHEARTPLNSILGFTELLASERAGPLTDKQRRYLDNVDRSGRHLLALVNDSLDLAKLEAGRMDMEIGPLEAEKVLQQVLAQVLPLADVRELELRLDCSSSLAIQADRRRLVQILLNLLSNAIKHSPAGGVISVTGRAAGERVVLAVADRGPGIPADQQERIFEDYAQVGVQNEGTGLGLPVSRRLAKLMGGELWVESTLGAGSTFRVSLPAAGAISAQAS
jgi:PAS domain S-box-containing protein